MTDRVANQKDGFGIIETVVVLALMLLIVVTTVPLLMDSVSALQLGADAQNIASELQLAKFRASSQSTQYQVVFSSETATSQLQKLTSSGGVSTFQDEGGPQAVGSSTTFINTPESVPNGAPSSMSAHIRFNAHGVPIDDIGTPTGSNGIYLGNGSTVMYAVTVPLSGRVQVWWYDGSQWKRQ